MTKSCSAQRVALLLVQVASLAILAGAPLRSATNQIVCGPCTHDFGPGQVRKQSVVLDDLIVAAGGPPPPPPAMLEPYMIAVVTGDEDHLGIREEIAYAESGPFDLTVFGIDPPVLQCDPGAMGARTFMVPHILEKQGLVASAPFTFDTTILATYTAGQAGIPAGPGAQLDLYLFDPSGAPMRGSTSNVCDPCHYDFT